MMYTGNKWNKENKITMCEFRSHFKRIKNTAVNLAIGASTDRIRYLFCLILLWLFN